MGNLVRLRHADFIDQRTLSPPSGTIVMLAACRREPADLVEVVKDEFSRLLADDNIQAAGEILDFLSDGVAHSRQTILTLAGETT